jgi:putative intracellular protease/amidase/mannose/cellobiose epimerase-like protein (N-acyl-D-glucosamine 2-epimerase family)
MARQFCQQTTILGRVTELHPKEGCFKLRARSGDEFYSYVNTETWYRPLPHLHGSYDHYGTPEDYDGSPEANVKKYLAQGILVLVEGVHHRDHTKRRLEVRTLYLLYSQNGKLISETQGCYMFEDPRWWTDLISAKGNRWFDTFFADGKIDFFRYRTELDIKYQPKSELQEVATLSRLLYGFAVTYQLTGKEKYLDALRAGVLYQRNTFRVSLPDGKSILWASYYDGTTLHLPSKDGDDNGTIPLYEQIYAIAGLTMYYRITGDLETLHDIQATVNAFDTYFLDRGPHGNYFSHLHPDTLSPANESLGINRARKNWNSVGDHVPAYLINLICALSGKREYKKECDRLHDMLIFITRDIVEHFPPTDGSQMVFERFLHDWTPELTYSWQQDRGIVGHNLKIAWNLTRVAFYLDNCRGKDADEDLRRACLDLAKKLGIAMDDIGGVDRFRGGCLDALERNPTNGFELMFPWMSTKDFWQQEQGILAYLILMGTSGGDHAKYENYRELAASMSAFYCAFFLDLDRGGVHFRVTEIGVPILSGIYGDKGGHAKSGYHIFELCYLAHIYTLMYNNPAPFTLYYSPIVPANGKLHLSIAPDFFPPHSINFAKSNAVVVGKGLEESITCTLKDFVVDIDLPKALRGTSVVVQVTLQPMLPVPTPEAEILPTKGKFAIVLESHFDEKEIEVIDSRLKKEFYNYELISTLWGHDYLEFHGNECHDPVRVYKDIDKVDIDDYVCFFFIGGYCMDRLYYQEDPKMGQANQSPVVNLVRKLAKANKICATICHSLWVFACDPKVLKGMKVTCAHNIIDSVRNAGGVVMYQPDGVGTLSTYEHDWLVSARHGGDTDELLDLIFAKLRKERRQ